MRRVVVTGMGVVSSIGANANEVTASLREARSGIVAAPDYAELGFRSQVKAAPNVALLDPKPVKFAEGDRLIELQTVFFLIRG